MLCEKIVGKIKEKAYAGYKIDYVDFEWHEAFKKLHKKESEAGIEVAIRLGDDILKNGLKEGDILGEQENTILVVRFLPCEVIVIKVEEKHEHMVAKVSYEIGNKHAPFFRGEDNKTFLTPYNEPMFQMLQKVHGISVKKEMQVFDFERNISATVHMHTH